MRARFKSHLEQLQRARTSTGRDMREGWCLDRNERVIEFPDEILVDLYRQLPKFVLNTYPDTNRFYDKLAEVFGAKGYYAEHPSEIADTVAEAVKSNAPAVIEIPVQEYFPPSAPTPR